MRYVFHGLLAVVAAALVGCAAVLAGAWGMAKWGWTGFAAHIERLPFRFGPDASLIGDNFDTDPPAFPLWVFSATVGAIMLLIFIFALRWTLRSRRGGWFVAAGTLAMLPLYVYLSWDEPALRFPDDQLEPGLGLLHVPREIALEATTDPTHGRASGWPNDVVQYHNDQPTREWLMENAEQIRTRWEKLKPVRDWAAKLENWPSFDDYIAKLTDPMLSFPPLRQLTVGSQEYALLCAAEGKHQEAADTLADAIRLGRRLQKGSRALVTLMIGVVIEKAALRNFAVLCEGSPQQRTQILATLARVAPIDAWTHFDRTVLTEIKLGQIAIDEQYSAGQGGWAKLTKRLRCVLFNPHAGVRIYHGYVVQILQSAKTGDFEAFSRQLADPKSEVRRFRFKNPAGYYIARVAPGTFEKVAKGVDELIKLRAGVTGVKAATLEPPLREWRVGHRKRQRWEKAGADCSRMQVWFVWSSRHQHMRTLGIDLSSQKENTAACLIEWQNGSALARPPRVGCSDEELDQLVAEAHVVGIDAPFGWPAEFSAAVGQWRHEEWTTELRDRLRFRLTDRRVRERQGRWPLSVSTDTIALPAMRAMALLARHGVQDRSGDGRFFEVYPAASLHAWGYSNRGYKELKKETCIAARKDLLAKLRTRFPELTICDEYAVNPDALDSLIAAMTARAAARGQTEIPTPEQRALSVVEGWIHVPVG
jgi:predicted nuclease with RNAse H fold